MPQEGLAPSHVVVVLGLSFSELTCALGPSDLLVCSFTSLPNAAYVACSLKAALTPDTRASLAVSVPRRAITAAAPIAIPISTEKNAIRNSRRNRGVCDSNPNSG